jgi:hypothetical protein
MLLGKIADFFFRWISCLAIVLAYVFKSKKILNLISCLIHSSNFVTAQTKACRLPSTTFNRSLSILETAEAKSLPNKVNQITILSILIAKIFQLLYAHLLRFAVLWRIASSYANQAKFTFVMDRSRKIYHWFNKCNNRAWLNHCQRWKTGKV